MSDESKITTLKTGKGRNKLRACIVPMGKHYVVTVTGGEAHIGAAALGEPYPEKEGKQVNASVSILTRITHKEDIIAGDMASFLAKELNVPVLVCCGIHLDGITKNEIDNIIKTTKTLQEQILISLTISH